MTRFDASSPEPRTALFAEAITAHRNRNSESAVAEAERQEPADSEPAVVRLVYEEGTITLQLTEERRERLDDVLAEFPVFKIQQPETRKAPEGTVYVSALADPKRSADFLEAVFRRVYELPENYQAWVVQV